ncbi:MAG: DNA mismatch repair protein MutS, partial [Clostridiales bacterium]|nr:DNA mismatch repair protein MutS [Clostridiales bacterium]
MGLTTMMQQYLAIKEQYKDAIVFFRLGDFYEMFFDDAITASRELELTLTGRDCGLPERAPMCGVPHHAVETYLARLIQRGYHVAICEQMTPPGKRELVKRQVVRLVTPGTVTENSILIEDKNNYLLSAYSQDGKIGVAWADISTGEFNYSFIDEKVNSAFNDLLSRIEPAEIICNDTMLSESHKLPIVKNHGTRPFGLYNSKAFSYQNALEKLKPQITSKNLQAIRDNRCICAAGALIAYIEETQKCALKNFSALTLDVTNQYMYIDANARRTLELTQSLADDGKRGTLFWCLDRTKTGMGARLLKRWIEKPEINETTITQRLEFVDTLQANAVLCQTLRDVLSNTYDIERLTSRLAFRSIVPADFLALSRSLHSATQLKELLQPINVPLAQTLAENIYDFTDEYKLIDAVIFDANSKASEEEFEGESEEPQQSDSQNKKKDKSEEKEKKRENRSRIFKDGYDAALDEARSLIKNSKKILKGMLEAEKETTGIKNLKLGFNNVFGYYLEVPKAQIDLVPYRYTRKQTVATGERYVTEELKELEEKILHAQENVENREAELYQAFIDTLSQRIHDYLHTARHVAMLDVLLSFAVVAKENNYT